MVVDGSAKCGIWRLWRVCARCVMSLTVSLCFNWKVRRSWRASMRQDSSQHPGVKPLAVLVIVGFVANLAAMEFRQSVNLLVVGLLLRLTNFLWPRRNCW